MANAVVGFLVATIFCASSAWGDAVGETEVQTRKIAKAERKVHKRFRSIEKKHRDDAVTVKDEMREAGAEIEGELAEAYLEVLMAAYTSPNRKLLYKRLSKSLKPKKLKELKSFIARLPAYIGNGQVAPGVSEDLFERAEAWADQDLKTIVKSYTPIVSYAANE